MFFTNFSRSIMVIASMAALAFSLSVDDPNNLIKNGGFDKDTMGTWTIYCHHSAKGTGGIVNGELILQVTKNGDYWDAQAFTSKPNWASLENGKTYILSFDAKSDVARTLVFAVEDGENYTPAEYNHNGGGKNPVNLTTTMQTFTSTFTADKTASNARICFNAGAAISTLTFDNVILIDTSKISQTAIRPQLANFSESGNSFGIVPDLRGITFSSYNQTNFGFQICSLSGKVIANANTYGQGSLSHYRVDYRSLGIPSGRYIARALNGDRRVSKIFSVMP
jgi:hypothetical protein